ncbi:protein arginine methyltransferase NDUFAF7, mitochondrial [Epinephelus fuscoguttatus]|uniref:protein arginine methyltransferase NDUFAF7, mitochondrial n=1 Tax=Epinephelus fuscoguttatus TaxID=293821 RepID=UPI0020D0CC69|nr:protein arginine methyltransferase NDUFAF7, mitochondrial [Epinephelus fuscoguttatus]
MRACFGVKTQLLISRVFSHPVSPSAAVRWRAAQTRLFCSPPTGEEKPQPSMLRHLISKIKATGPITVAEYMREVLTNPLTGYYVRNNMLGPDGDFITSPEISQIFGELLGVWIISEWMGAGRPKHLQLVELGPGKGSLASDVLRVFSQLQSQLFNSQEADAKDEPVYRRNIFNGLPVSGMKGWREVMVDIDPEKPGQLRFVVVPSPTLASSTLVQADERRGHVEVCAEGGVFVQQLARRIENDGGAALIADYGHDGTKTDTFRGFKGHQLHDVLSSPGSADLTADVDFSYLRKMAGGGVACLGPVTQRLFLKNMGIDSRMQVLLRNCSDASTRKQLISSYDMLTNPAKMGERFLFFSLLHHSRLAEPKKQVGLKLEKKSPAPLPVAGFTELSFS